jgi:hypothetical protein
VFVYSHLIKLPISVDRPKTQSHLEIKAQGLFVASQSVENTISPIINCLQNIKGKEYACLPIIKAWARAFLNTFLTTTFYQSQTLAEEH